MRAANESEFHGALRRLCNHLSCPTPDLDLWESVFTHSSLRNERLPSDNSTQRMKEIVARIGTETLRTSVYEYCLDQKDMDPAETSYWSQAKGSILDALVIDFRLINLYQVGAGFRGFEDNRALQRGLAEQLLGLVTCSSCYNHARRLIWDRIDSTLFQSVPSSDAANVDPKSRLQEYCHRTYGSRSKPLYDLLREEGPDHKKQFWCRVVLPDKKTAEGSGGTLKAAQKEAAVLMLRTLLSAPETSYRPPQRSHTNAPCLDVDPRRIDPYFLSVTDIAAEKLLCPQVDRHHLAVALTLLRSAASNISTNVRHKLSEMLWRA